MKTKLEEQIKKGDKFKKWGEFNSSEAKKIFVEPIEEEVKYIDSQIKIIYKKKGLVSVADIGGANGWISKKIIDKTNSNVSAIDIIDIDKSKFPKDENPKVNFIYHDTRKPFNKKYDVCFSRLLLHYLPVTEQKKVCKNIVDSLNAGGSALIIDICPIDENNKQVINNASSYIQKIKGANKRTFLLIDEYKELFKGIPNVKIKFKQGSIITLSSNNFYKERYNLDIKEELDLHKKMSNKSGKVRIISTFINKV